MTAAAPMSGTPRVRIGVCPAAAYDGLAALWAALRDLFPVEFEALGAGDVPPGVGGVVSIGGDGADRAAGAGAPSLIYASGEGVHAPVRPHAVQFGNSTALEPCLRRRSLRERSDAAVLPCSPQSGEEIVATLDGRPCWLRRQGGGTEAHLLALPPPRFERQDRLIDHFCEQRFVRLLPLLQFLRDRTASRDWEPPPLRACYIFDDPNLRRPRYGCLDFRELAAHSLQHGYRAAIAMVPLDAAWAEPEAVAVFRDCADRLSLLVHGDNHTRTELLRCRSPREAQALLAEALRRVADFEHRHALTVDRVMEAPHGVIAREVFPALAALGFEAAMVTFAQTMRFLPRQPWPVSFGMEPAEVMPGGLGAIPRILMRSDWRTAAALAAFLRQPVVVAGHHEDVREGLDVLADFASEVNSLGAAQWLSPAGIARTNFKTLRAGDTLRVLTYQRRIEVDIPAGTAKVEVERVWIENGATEPIRMAPVGGGAYHLSVCGRISHAVDVPPCRRVEVYSAPEQMLDPNRTAEPSRRLWPVVRRLLTEGRDRAYPWLHPRCGVHSSTVRSEPGDIVRNPMP